MRKYTIKVDNQTDWSLSTSARCPAEALKKFYPDLSIVARTRRGRGWQYTCDRHDGRRIYPLVVETWP